MFKITNERILRNLLFGFAIIFGMLGTSLISIGVLYIDELGFPKTYMGIEFVEFSTVIIIIGSLSLIMAIAGCFLRNVDNTKLIITFVVCMVVIMCLQLATGIISFLDVKHRKTRRFHQTL